MILINFKTYPETFGDGAIKLAKIVKSISDKYNIRIVIASSALDAFRIKEQSGAEVWLQSINQYAGGKHTGSISMEQAQALDINGSLVNHFENQIPQGKVLSIIASKPKNFEIMCCAKTNGQIERWISKSKTDYILFEPPELIGSSTDSVASKPESIKRAVMLAGSIPLMVGAGVKSREDVITSLKMGAKSVGLASGFVLSANPQAVLEDIVSGFKV